MIDCSTLRVPYRQTDKFSAIVLDYIDQDPSLQPFFSEAPSFQGILKTIEKRKEIAIDRALLVEVLKKQYESVDTTDQVNNNIELLLSENTFTICTAHQPNILTGPLYFIYKIIHTIKLADQLNESMPDNRFVPVFYIGSEDADLDELGHLYVNGEKLKWDTKQTGAVGRMKVDAEFLKLIERVEGELAVHPHGEVIIAAVKKCYPLNESIETGTFHFVNFIFRQYGLIVLMPDNASLKKSLISVFEDDLFKRSANEIVEQSSKKLSALYKVQASPREINLFYLKDDLLR